MCARLRIDSAISRRRKELQAASGLAPQASCASSSVSDFLPGREGLRIMAKESKPVGGGASGVSAVKHGGGHQPYIPADKIVPEFTWAAVLVGAVLGIIFGASSLYLVLKVGMTVSASIPVAVLSITLFRVFSKIFKVRQATILENNIVQTTGSAGESIAFGVGVTMPAVMILGFDMELTRVMIVSILGGALGILMMIPLRRAFIVKQHETLKYPEGTACADVLIIGETGGSSAKTVFSGFGVAFVYQFLMEGLRLWKDTVERPLDFFKGATPAIEISPALLGVGYIIGTRTACIMAAGGFLSAFVLAPMIRFFGDGLASSLGPATKLISSMDAGEIRNNYILFIGAGAVAAGGIISLCRAMPLIVSSILSGLRDMRDAISGGKGAAPRTDRDLPLKVVFIGSMALVALIGWWLGSSPEAAVLGGGEGGFWPFARTYLLAPGLIVLFGFLFVTVSSRLTGEIGSSSNPISGMTIATLLLTCLLFLILGWQTREHSLLALSIAAVVCIAASNGGTTSQDLKTGYLVGATPKYQQLAILVGATSSALVIGGVLLVLNQNNTVYSMKNLPQPQVALDMAEIRTHRQETPPGTQKPLFVWYAEDDNAQGVPSGKYLVDERGVVCYFVDPGINGKLTRRDDGAEVRKFNAPTARLMAMITKGILTQKLPWALVALGVCIAVVMELCGVSALPFAVGVYLPLSSSTPILVGGLVRYVVDRRAKKKGDLQASELDSEMSSGVLLSTGYIAGGTIASVIIAFVFLVEPIKEQAGLWQYRKAPAAEAISFDAQCAALTRSEVGEGASQNELEREFSAIKIMNEKLLPNFALVREGMKLTVPGEKEKDVEKDQTLGEWAAAHGEKPSTILDLNANRIGSPAALPAGTIMELPQRDSPALAAFGVLAALLLATGIFAKKEEA